MNTLQLFSFLWLLFALTSVCAFKKCKKICVLSNRKCVTRGGFQVYKTVVEGVKGLVSPTDPLYLKEVKGEMQSVKYTLTNITLTGLKNCVVTELVVNADESIYKQYLNCPKLMAHFHFEAKQNSSSSGLKGKGEATMTAYDYDILNKGDYGVFVNETGHNPHFFVKTLETTTHPKGKVVFTSSKTCHDDSQEENDTEKHMNKYWRQMEQFLFYPIIKKSMKIVIHNIDVYIRKYTMGEVLPEDNDY